VALNVDVIAERRIELRSSGQTSEVVVRLARPELDESKEAWMCAYEIQVGDTIRSMAMHGADSMQALQLSIATLDGELAHIAKKRGGVLWHFDEPFNSILENGGLLLRPLAQASP
jgi:hypothetical protein